MPVRPRQRSSPASAFRRLTAEKQRDDRDKHGKLAENDERFFASGYSVSVQVSEACSVPNCGVSGSASTSSKPMCW